MKFHSFSLLLILLSVLLRTVALLQPAAFSQNTSSAITWTAVRQSIAAAARASDSANNPCTADLLYALNHFLSPRSIFLYLAHSGLPAYELGDYAGCQKRGGRYFYTIVDYGIPWVMNGVCLPGSCTYDNAVVFKDALAGLLAVLSGYPITRDNVYMNDSKDMVDRYETLSTNGIIVWVLIVLMIFAGVIGTVVVYLKRTKAGTTRAQRIANCFDLVTGLRSLVFSENVVDPSLNSLNGIRVFAMAWIILGHMLETLKDLAPPLVNPRAAFTSLLTERVYSVFVSAFFSVDVFFLLSGFLATLICDHQLKSTHEPKALAVIKLYFYRMIRFIPLYGLCILMFKFVIKTLYDGPLYYMFATKDDQALGCPNWYLNMLFINNFVKDKEDCFGWSWYISCDFQMFLLVPLLCLIYGRRKLYGCLSVAALFVCSTIIQIFVFYHYTLSLSISRSSGNTRSVYYIKPYCRINPYLIGVLFAWMYQSFKSPSNGLQIFTRINRAVMELRLVRYAMYIAGMVLVYGFIYSYFDFYKEKSGKSIAEDVCYIIVARCGLPLGLMLIIYPSFLGRGCFVQAFIGHDLFNFLAKLSYAVYIFNHPIVEFYYKSMEQSFYFTAPRVLIQLVETFVLVHAFCFLAVLFVGSPLVLLSKEFLRTPRKKCIQAKDSAPPTTLPQ